VSKLRVGVIGAGFWARYQILAWMQIPGVEVTAITNRTIERAKELSRDLEIPTVSVNSEELVRREDVDVVDVITSESSHRKYTLLAARAGKHIICQKPMAESFADCEEMVAVCHEAGVRLLIHDNWRWQAPIRRFLERYREHPVGRAYRGRFSYLSSFPVFDMQPALRKAKRFILMDMGTHIVDTARAFLGDFEWVVSQIATLTTDVAGEDLATVLAGTANGTHCVIELSYASPTEREHELETIIRLECERGVMELDHDFRSVVTTRDGRSISERFEPTVFDWVVPRFALSMGSCLPANQDFYKALVDGTASETEGSKYLNTMEAVFAAYESAAKKRRVELSTGGNT
jgi:D-apiose dehydrogenase